MTTIESIIDLLNNYKQDKISLALLLATMQDSEDQAIKRLDEILAFAQKRLTARRKELRVPNKLAVDFEYKCWSGLVSLINEAKPIILQIAQLDASQKL